MHCAHFSFALLGPHKGFLYLTALWLGIRITFVVAVAADRLREQLDRTWCFIGSRKMDSTAVGTVSPLFLFCVYREQSLEFLQLYLQLCILIFQQLRLQLC